MTCSPVLAKPMGGQVVGGNARITEGDTSVSIKQRSPRAVIDWRQFDVGSKESVTFQQPSNRAVILNRIKDIKPSNIAGRISANGNVILSNPNGMVFSKAAQVDVNGLLATSADISNQAFMAGSNYFDLPGKADAMVINDGQLKAQETGLIGLVAPRVINNGLIEAKLGQVALAAGDGVVVDFYHDGLLSVEVRGEELQHLLVANSGELKADGGTVLMTTAAAKQIINSLIIADGSMQAKSVSQDDTGAIIISSANKANSYTTLAGSLDVSGKEKNQTGGEVVVTSDHISLEPTSTIDASGDIGGGNIRIGGDYKGEGELPTANTTYVTQGSQINNDAITNGDGGRTIVWADDTTSFSGSITARGGMESGNGGFVETSGKVNLLANGEVDLSPRAEGYNKGEYLLDPANISIYGNFAPNYVSTDASLNLNTNLVVWLDGNDLDGDGVAEGLAESGLTGSDATTWVDKATGVTVTAGSPATYQDRGDGLFELDFDSDYYIVNYDLRTGTTPNMTIFFHASHTNTGDIGLWGTDNGGFDRFQLLNNDLDSSIDYIITDTNSGGLAVNALNTTNDFVYAAILAQGVSNGSFAYVNSNQEVNFTESHGNNANSTYEIGAIGDNKRPLIGKMHEHVLFDTNLSDSPRQLIEQYLSAKWGTALTPPGTGGDEQTRAMAADGYGVFTTRYLERLSGLAHVNLTATSDINVDLKTDTLTLANNQNIDLNAGNDITIDSDGDIVTSGTGSITLDAGNNLTLSQNFNLNSGGSGNIDLIAGNDLTVGATNTITANTGVIALDAGGNITLNNGLSSSSSSADAIRLSATGNFVSNAGATPFTTPSSNWIVYSNNPVGNQNNGLLPATSLFNQANLAAAQTAAAGSNALAYTTATQPVITYDVDNNSVAFNAAITGNSITYNSGLVGDDVIGGIGQTGSATFAGYTPGDAVGTYLNQITATVGTLANSMGYTYSFNPGDLTITGSAPAPSTETSVVIPDTVLSVINASVMTLFDSPTIITTVSDLTPVATETSGSGGEDDDSPTGPTRAKVLNSSNNIANPNKLWSVASDLAQEFNWSELDD